MNNALNAFRVGLVVISALAVGIFFFASSRKSTLTDDNSVPYFAYLTDASGINAKSLITVAGLQVGEIQSVILTPAKISDVFVEEIPEGKDPDMMIRVAKVEMRIIKSVRIPDDSWLKKESLGLLGAKALFLELGNSTVDVVSKGQITHVRSDTGMDVIFKKIESVASSVEKIAARLEDDLVGITKDIKGITGTLARFVEGDGENPPLDELYSMVVKDIRRVVKTINSAVGNVDKMVVANDHAVKKLLANISDISEEVESLIGSGKKGVDGGTEEGDIRKSLASVRQITDDLAVVTSSFKEILGENEGDFSDGVKKLKHTLTELNGTLTNLSEITGRIENGEGSIGKLLTDEHMADKLEAAVVGASEYVSTLTSIEAHIDLGTYYSMRRGASNVNFQLRIQPKPDKYYLVEIVDDGGTLERLTRTVTSNGETINGERATTERKTIAEDLNQVRITAMFAKKFWNFLVLRAGLIESSGGVGADLFFWDDRIHLRADLFNFGGPRNSIDGTDSLRFQSGFVAPRLRSWIKFQPVPFVYAMAGVDDLLNFGWGGAVPDPSINAQGYGIDVFFGVGIAFQDDDLRTILPFIPNF